MAADGAGGGETALSTEGIVAPGDVIGGKFVVERVLGVGGMGIVVAARHMQLGQTVAIKFLRRNAAASSESVNRFLREARAAVGLQSAHVVRIMDVGTLEDGLPYMVMEHLSGTDLAHVVEVRRTLPLQEAVDYLLQAMEAIAEAHAIGIVHRDLKPSNLFLTVRPDGTPLVKVLDFGISKAIDDGSQQASLTSTAMVMGSPLYMSPEQVRSTKNVDMRTDVWALGVILYELLAGGPPFEADTITGLCAKIVADPPVPLRTRRPDLPAALEAIVVRCLDKDAKKRPQSVAALATALRPFASADGKSAVERVARIGAGSRSSQKSIAQTSQPPKGGAISGGVEHASGYAETVPSQQVAAIPLRRRGVVIGMMGLVIAVVAVMGLARGRLTRIGPAEGGPASTGVSLGAPVATAATVQSVPSAAGIGLQTSSTAQDPPPAALPSPQDAASSPSPASSPMAAAQTSLAPAPASSPLRSAPVPRSVPARPTSAKPPGEDLLQDRK
ncbi:MAG TPA: protein kinase [Polyangiaceae bacterium]|nr:protein kinase [Polyangiaceae bacterium]